MLNCLPESAKEIYNINYQHKYKLQMKKVILKSVLAVTLALFISGCAGVHKGYMGNSAILNQANFSYVKMNIKGEAKAKYIFWFGGYKSESLINDAKQQMLLNNPLKSNQALVNITVNYKVTFTPIYLIVAEVKCVVTADVVEFK